MTLNAFEMDSAPSYPRASHRRARGLFANQCGLCALSPAQHGQHLIYRLLVHRLNVECPKEQVPLKVCAKRRKTSQKR